MNSFIAFFKSIIHLRINKVRYFHSNNPQSYSLWLMVMNELQARIRSIPAMMNKFLSDVNHDYLFIADTFENHPQPVIRAASASASVSVIGCTDVCMFVCLCVCMDVLD